MTLSEAAFSYELAVVPMFILMGNVLSRTGISEDLFRAANAFLGGVRGGLALATMVTCAGFSAVCGSSFATAATMAKVAYPSMQKYGYSDRLASATIAAGGTLGILIPPSIILMIYGILTQQNIGELFIAGVLPGLLGLAMYMGVIYLIACSSPNTPHAAIGVSARSAGSRCRVSGRSWRCSCSSSAASTWAGSTATEAGGMAPAWRCSSQCCSGAWAGRASSEVMKETAFTSVMLYVVLFGAMLFSQLISFSGLADELLSLCRAQACRAWGCCSPSWPSSCCWAA
jgi:tripartite ATP-independent transporter DctM subunit